MTYDENLMGSVRIYYVVVLLYARLLYLERCNEVTHIVVPRSTLVAGKPPQGVLIQTVSELKQTGPTYFLKMVDKSGVVSMDQGL